MNPINVEDLENFLRGEESRKSSVFLQKLPQILSSLEKTFTSFEDLVTCELPELPGQNFTLPRFIFEKIGVSMLTSPGAKSGDLVNREGTENIIAFRRSDYPDGDMFSAYLHDLDNEVVEVHLCKGGSFIFPKRYILWRISLGRSKQNKNGISSHSVVKIDTADNVGKCLANMCRKMREIASPPKKQHP